MSRMKMHKDVKQFIEAAKDVEFIAKPLDLESMFNPKKHTLTIPLRIAHNTPYCNGSYSIRIKFSRNYPFHSPVLTFNASPYAANTHNGNIKCEYWSFGGSGWSSDITLMQVVEKVYIDTFIYCGCQNDDMIVNTKLYSLFESNPKQFLINAYDYDLKLRLNSHKDNQATNSVATGNINYEKDVIERSFIYVTNQEYKQIEDWIVEYLNKNYSIPIIVTKNCLLSCFDRITYCNLDKRLINLIDSIPQKKLQEKQESKRIEKKICEFKEMIEKMDEKDYNIHISTLTGNIMSFVVDVNKTTVEDLKLMIQVKEGHPHAPQTLIFAGKQLQNDCLLSTYGVVPQSKLHLVLRYN